MGTKLLWQYQLRSLGKTLAAFIAVMMGIALILIAALMTTFHLSVVNILAGFSEVTKVIFIFVLVWLAFQLLQNWRFLIESGYTRQQLFQQGWQLSLLFCLFWTLLVYIGSIIPKLNQMMMFRMFDFADYQHWFGSDLLDTLSVCLLNSELISLIFAVGLLLSILQTRFKRGLFWSTLIMIYLVGIAIFIFSNFAAQAPTIQRIIGNILGYNPSGPDNPLKLISVLLVIDAIIWLGNWQLWRGYESEVAVK